MPTFLPSAQFVRVVLALLVVVGGVSFAYYLAKAPAEVSKSDDTSSSATLIPIKNPLLEQVANLDTDGDGLRDWEERLWKTNVMKKDTDGDKTEDGDEVAMRRNPLVKGPNDLLRDTIDLEEALTPESLEGLTSTERIAREFFVEYMSYKKGGKALTSSEQQRLLLSTLQRSASSAEGSVTYTEKNVILATADDMAAYKVYGNAIGYAILKNSFKSESELVLLERAMRTQSSDDLIAIRKISDGYKAMLAEFLLVPTPPSLVSQHIALLEQISTLAGASYAMTLVLDDPIQSLVSVANYETYVGNLLVAFQNIQTPMLEKGITFAADEPGVLLMETGKNSSS